MKIVALYLVKNEEEFLCRSFDSVVPYVDDTVVVNTNSTDRTAEFCGDRCVKHHFIEDDFSTIGERTLRKIGLMLCGDADWIVQVDGDVILGDKWRDEFEQYVGDTRYGWGQFRFYEHMGSYEYVHKGIQQTHMGVIFRNHYELGFMGGINAKGTHGSLIPSARPQEGFTLEIGYYHYAYAKRDIVKKLHQNIRRGDWGDFNEAAIASEEAAWAHLPPVEPVPYGEDLVPHPMRDLFGQTYRLDLGPDGKILKRTKIED